MTNKMDLKHETRQTFKELQEIEDYLHYMKMDIACMIFDHLHLLGIDSNSEAELFSFSKAQEIAWTKGDIDSFYVHDLKKYINILSKFQRRTL